MDGNKSDVTAGERTPEEIERESQARVAKLLASQAWRLANLYWVENEAGKKVKFRPRWEQRELHNNLHTFNAVLKCRQPGISTYVAILMLDFVLFSPSKVCGIIDKTDEDAKRKLEKITFAYDHLDDPEDPTTAAIGALVKSSVWQRVDNKKEFALSNGSRIWAGTNMRGGTIQFLWWTEAGYTSYYYPDKAKEIVKGALNTVHAGSRIVVESTHEGGKYGAWYAIIKRAQESCEPLSPLDWRAHFFPWHKHAAYQLPAPPGWEPDRDMAKYFDELADVGVVLSDAQKFWYAKKAETMEEFMKSEYPSTPEEAFEGVVKGAIYGKYVSAIRAKRRIVDFEHDRSAPLYAFWDIGNSDFTSIWLLQFPGRDICALEYRCNCGQNESFYVAIIREWERKYEMPVVKNLLPHDAANKQFGNRSAEGTLRAAGLTNIEIVSRTPDVWVGIRHLRSLLPRFYIHKTACGQTWKRDDLEMPSGIQCLENYHTRESGASGVIREEPVHDENSHGCDALRTYAEADQAGLLPKSSAYTGGDFNAGPPKVILAGWNAPRSPANAFRPRVIKY